MTIPASVTYPFDSTGILPGNKVIGEQHSVTETNFRNYYFIVPVFAPFFAESIVLIHSYQGVNTRLVEDVDYYCALPFIGATRAIGRPVYGAITFNNLKTAGVVSINYQTLGGNYCVDQQYVLQQIAEKAYNPRTVSWEHIVEVPAIFPPGPHQWDLVDLVGEAEVVAGLADIEAAILYSSQQKASNHLTDFNNPHQVTKEQVGLGNVGNWARASNLEATAGVSTDTLIVPSTLRSVLQKFFTKDEINDLLTQLTIATQEKIDVAIASTPELVANSRAKNYFIAQF